MIECISLKRGREGKEERVRGGDKSKPGMVATRSSIRLRSSDWTFRVKGDFVLFSSRRIEAFGKATFVSRSSKQCPRQEKRSSYYNQGILMKSQSL